MAGAITVLYNKLRNPEIRKWIQEQFHDPLFHATTGHDHDGVNSAALSPAAVIADDAVTTVKILDANVTGAKIATGAISDAKLATDAVTTVKIANLQVTTGKIDDDAVTTAKIAAGAVTATELGADAVTAAKIGDDVIDSEHYAAGSIDTEHIGNLQITTALIAADAITGAKIADDAIDSEHYTDASIDVAHLSADCVDKAKIAADVAGNGLAQNVDGSLEVRVDDSSIEIDSDILRVKALGVASTMIAADAITGAKLADNAVNSEHITAGSVDLAHMSVNSVDSDQYVDASIDTEHLAAITTPTAKAIVAAHAAAIPVTGNGNLALTIADAAETNTLAVPTFAGQIITISCDTRAGSGARVVTVASAINATGNNTITFDAAGEFISLYGIKLGATFAWRVLASDGAGLTTVG